ncbi:MAG TPA: ATP-binding protein [Nocardioidaceae bacterium]|nr:ATP-binding protein [Nocardioidaceae bacterium]
MPQVIVVAGPSGSGKSRLCSRLGLPTVNLDDFYKDRSDPTLPRLEMGGIDWDHLASWHRDEAVAAIVELCTTGAADLPVYDMARDVRSGSQRLDLAGSENFVAEGLFAPEIVAACRTTGCLADAVCVRNRPVVTFWRRLTRDLRERRKPPHVAVRLGLMLLRAEPAVVARAVAAGCAPLTGQEAYERLSSRQQEPRSSA